MNASKLRLTPDAIRLHNFPIEIIICHSSDLCFRVVILLLLFILPTTLCLPRYVYHEITIRKYNKIPCPAVSHETDINMLFERVT